MVPLTGVLPVADMFTPLTATPAPPVLLFLNVKLARLPDVVFIELLVKAKESPLVAVDVKLDVPLVEVKLSAPVVNVNPLLAVNVWLDVNAPFTVVVVPDLLIETALAVVVPIPSVPAVIVSIPLPAARFTLPEESIVSFVEVALSNFKKFPVNEFPPALSKSIYKPLPVKFPLLPPLPSLIMLPEVIALAVASNTFPEVITVELSFAMSPVVRSIPNT